jgi:oligoendopeptidase F
MEQIVQVPERKQREFLPQHLTIDAWSQLEPFFEDLLNRQINSKEELETWLKDRSETEAVLEEDMAWRYIKMNIDTTSEELQKSFEFFVNEIQPHIIKYSHELNKKLVDSAFTEALDKEKYFIYLRAVKKEIEIFREENIPLFTEMQKEEQKYGALCAQMTVEIDGKEMTLQKAGTLLKDPDRFKREEAFRKINAVRLRHKKTLDDLFDNLIRIRTQIAHNAGFENYRDYKFVELGRFDYTVKDCFEFHDSVQKVVVPMISKLDYKRKDKLGLSALKPWDTEVDTDSKPALKPFETGEDLAQKTINCFRRLDPYFADCLSVMRQLGYLDLESKKGKAPGGFNYPLYEIGIPFIYMNAVGSFRDMVTMLHEGGHAVHSFLTRDLEITAFKSVPSEVAELASMAMELISMDAWNEFFDDPQDLKRAKNEQLEGVLDTLPWIAAIDKFQHWIYENPYHTQQERGEKWRDIYLSFSSSAVDWSGEQEMLTNLWQKQLHLYEVPFYYIEYGFAQLGAVSIFKNFKSKGRQAIEDYKSALALGYTVPIGEIYRKGGIKFDFTEGNVADLMKFIHDEMISD